MCPSFPTQPNTMRKAWIYRIFTKYLRPSFSLSQKAIVSFNTSCGIIVLFLAGINEWRCTLKAVLDCLECIARQALRAARIATDDQGVQRRIVDDAVLQIPGMDLCESPALLSLPLYQIAMEHSGNPDPYKELRRQQNEFAMGLEDELRGMVADSDDPLVTALHLAAAGNVIDLGAQYAGNIDVHEAIDSAIREKFTVDHSDAFKESLSSSNDLLYLLDNAGEVVFDKILIEELLKHTKVTAVVKAGPIINDVLMEDVEQVGLTQLCEVIDNGGAFVGCPLKLVPESFLERMKVADVIIGKGQGNYETIDEFPGDIFLILRAKCEVIARHMGVKLGQVALISTRERAKKRRDKAGARS